MISPLKALIKDQVNTLKEHNIKACGIYDGMDKSDGIINAILCLHIKLNQINQCYLKILFFDILMSS